MKSTRTTATYLPSRGVLLNLQQQAEEYRRAQQALDPNDLGAYQQAIERLGQLIEQAQRLTEAPRSSTTAHTGSPP